MIIIILLAIVMLGTMVVIIVSTIQDHRKPSVPFIDEDELALRATLDKIRDGMSWDDLNNYHEERQLCNGNEE